MEQSVKLDTAQGVSFSRPSAPVLPISGGQDRVRGKDGKRPFTRNKHEHKHPYSPISGVKCNFTLGGRWEGPIQCTCFMRNLWLRPSFTLFPKVLTRMEKLGLFPFSYVVCSNHFLACSTLSPKSSGSSPVRRSRDQACLILPPPHTHTHIRDSGLSRQELSLNFCRSSAVDASFH